MDDAIYKFYPPTVLGHFDEGGKCFVRFRCTIQYEALKAMGQKYSQAEWRAAEPSEHCPEHSPGLPHQRLASIDIRTAALCAVRAFIDLAKHRQAELEHRGLQPADSLGMQSDEPWSEDWFVPKIRDIFEDEDGLQQVELEVVFPYATLEAMCLWKAACQRCIDGGDGEAPHSEIITPYLPMPIALEEAVHGACQAFCAEAHLELNNAAITAAAKRHT